MMKKIVACLDCKDGKLVKGVNFVDIKEIADPVERAKYYADEGIDELVYYDITASNEGRGNRIDVAKKIAEICNEKNIPFTVGGGIATLEDIEEVFKAGADKVSINTAAIKRPEFIKEASEKFGSQKIMVALDGKKNEKGSWNVYVKGGTEDTGIDVIELAKKFEKFGAGELCMNSIDGDGSKLGYDLELTRRLNEELNIPVIASGGAGTMEHFKEAFDNGADSALGASVFHFNEIDIHDLKRYLIFKNIEIDWSCYENENY
ncbi:imidazole glycerol phosphate synthase subunit HisF [Miniphocaeibacter massiliensis]|uniref:imidazole glycerol phosphate synthase subunit HisF n=1 Tax=Miniphocaeibacter massiliensis TaxID=2041841 RepID=UPI000C07DF69|nr:imidazole glycerol phosphate synthase subunit HisF [Miniphocaeibacter massiliensis]